MRTMRSIWEMEMRSRRKKRRKRKRKRIKEHDMGEDIKKRKGEGQKY